MSGVSDQAGVGEEFDGTFTCLTCGKSYTTKSNALHHFREVHVRNSEKSFECKYCGKYFARKRYLHDHNTRIKCGVANKSLRNLIKDCNKK